MLSVAGYIPKDYAYGAPSRREAWTTLAGGMVPLPSYPFQQVGQFPNNTVISCPDAPDLNFKGDYTIDFWMAASVVTGAHYVIGKYPGAGYAPWMIQQSVSSLFFYASSASTSWDIANGINIANGFPVSTWFHVAVTKQGSTYRSFINGTQSATWTSSLTPVSGGPVQLGGNTGDLTSCFYGFLDEFRLSNGIARWTAPFTPPNQPYHARLDLGGNDDATKLLLHFDGNHIYDAAASQNASKRVFYNAGATLIGTPTSTSLSAAVLQVTGGATRIMTIDYPDLMWGRANFTLDFMYYRTANVGGHIITRRNSGSSYAPFIIYDNQNGNIGFYASTDNANWNIASNVTIATGIALNTWYHMAMVRNGSDLAFYVNGVRTYTQNIGATVFMYTPADWWNVGGTGDSGYNQALFEEIRFSDVARWTGNFAPPVVGGAPYGPPAVFSYDPYEVLVLHCDGTNGAKTLPDSSYLNKRNDATFVGTSVISTAQFKFGNASLYNNGGGYVTFPASRDFEFYGGDFTIDWWEYRTGSGCPIARDLATTYCPFLLEWTNVGEIYMTSNGTSWDIANGAAGLPAPGFGPHVLNAWTHLAVTRNGSTFRAFRDGVQKSTWTSTLNIIGNGNPLCIGAAQNGQNFNGYMDEIRISKGIARWTANFTPPAAPYGAAAKPATQFSVTSPAAASINAAFNITVQALDANGNPTYNYSVTVHFTSSDGAAVLPADSTLPGGAKTFSVQIKTVGAQTITATDTVVSTVKGTTAAIAASAGPATPQLLAWGNSTTWTVPADWTTNNSIECIGGGGNGGAGQYNNGGGGGGAYSKVSNVALTPGTVCTIRIDGPGGYTLFQRSDGATLCQAAPGAPGPSGAGGNAANGVGDIRYNGGAGGAGGQFASGGGGGAAGPYGYGAPGSGPVAGYGAAGGGGNGGGAGGGSGAPYYTSGAGGNNYAGYGGGPAIGGSYTDGGHAGYAGVDGGGGSGGVWDGYAHGNNAGSGGNGGNGPDFGQPNLGSGGGGGGGASAAGGSWSGGHGGFYGGGGGGGFAAGGVGRTGLIVVRYQ